MTRRLPAALVVALFVLVNAVFTAPSASAQSGGPPPLRLDVDGLNPRIVTEKTSALDVAVTVTNVSGRPVGDLSARLEQGAPATTPDGLRPTLTGQDKTTPWTQFQHLRAPLQPGQRARWTLHVDLTKTALSPNTVYPLLVNVNGTPDGGVEARLAEVHMSLPVIASPGGKPPAKPSKKDVPRPVSVLWPIADRPRVTREPVDTGDPKDLLLLADDQLAADMRPGGRLNALVSAAQGARANRSLYASLCFAIDPALIATASQMAKGYEVTASDGATKKGTGSADATHWLAALRKAVAGHCVVTLPYDQADVSSLAQSSPSLATSAADSSRDKVLEKVLGAHPESAVSYVPGKLTAQGAGAYQQAKKTVLLTGSNAVGSGREITAPTSVDTDGQTVVPFDDLTSLAMDSNAAHRKGETVEKLVSAGQPHVSSQNAISTLLLSSIGDAQSEKDPLVLAPSPTWTATPGEYGFLLQTIGQFTAARRIRPVPLESVLQATPTGSVTPQKGTPLTADIPPDVVGRMTGVEQALPRLTKAMAKSKSEQVEPSTVTAGVDNALISVASQAWSTDADAKRRRAENAVSQYHALTGSVRVADPGRIISLGSESAPILVTIRNRLPVDVTARVHLDNTTGLQIGKIPDADVSANTTRNLTIPTKALRAGRFTVGVTLVTPDGTSLGRPATFRLASTEYGSFTIIVTVAAAGALLLLSGRRIYRRLRSGKKAEARS